MKPLVLIVDDSPENLAVLDGLFRTNWTVKAAPNGQLALKIAGLSPHPQLIVLDIVMAGMDGFEVLARLKGQEATSQIPVILVSGELNDGIRFQASALGAADLFSKPIDGAQLLTRAAELLPTKDSL